MIGEPQRAFYGNQFGLTFPVFVHFGVPLWVPEVGGATGPGNEAHDLVMSVFGGMSKGERSRVRVRVRTSMGAQAQIEGRFLGGRPPYGYRLSDAGPHPNPAKAADGRRLHRLEPDPATAPVVRRIFAEFLAGRGLFAIAEGLTRDGVLCPSAYDPGRNRHRSGIAWSKGAVRAILTNPRYTGRQVWNRQRKDEVLLDVDDVALGHTTKMRWNAAGEWIWSDQQAHEALADAETIEQVRHILTARSRGPIQHKPHRRLRVYPLRGVLFCGLCDRRMQGHWSNDRPYYRCRFPQEHALANHVQHPRNVCLRQDALLDPVDRWLATVFAPHRIEETIDGLHVAQDLDHRPDQAEEAARRTIAACDQKLARYRAALEAGTDPELVARWTAEVNAERIMAQSQVRRATGRTRMSRDEVAALVAGLGDMLTVLRQADPADKAEVYRQLGLHLRYQPGQQTVRAEAHLNPHRIGKWSVSEGRKQPNTHTPAGHGCHSVAQAVREGSVGE